MNKNKKLWFIIAATIIGLLVLGLVIIFVGRFPGSSQKESEFPQAEVPQSPSLGDCLAFHVFQSKLVCLVNLRTSLGLAYLNAATQKLELKVKFDPSVTYENFYWDPENETILIQDYDYEFYFAKNTEVKRLNGIVMANWFGENEIIAAKKIDDQYQLVTISPESQEIIRTFSSLDIVPEYIEVSPDKTTLLMIYPTDIADEKSLVIWKDGKANILRTDLAIIKASWLDESHLLALTNEGITLLDLINNKQKTLIENPELIDMIFHYNNSLGILSIYDSSTNQIKDFDIQMPALKTQKDLEGLSEITQIYKEQNYYWVIADSQLYKLEL